MSKVTLSFLGAAGTVTGSRYLVETGKHKVLVDCGLFQGKKELRQKNWERFQVDPKSIDAIVLTHAHIDHIGFLPVLARDGFAGKIFCTPATDELVKILLADSAKLQEEEASYAEKAHSSKHNPPKPLYDSKDAKLVYPLLSVVPFGKATEILPGIKIMPRQAGHILGSANITMDVGDRRITFSGDVGRYGMPILNDPEPVELGNLLLCEATYGDKLHGHADMKGEILGVIQEAYVRKAPLIIPAFALGRTQTLLYFLSELEQEGRIPRMPVFVDSPMAANVSEIYRRYPENYDAEMRKKISESPLSTKLTQFCRTIQQSKEINSMEGSRIIISASGMVNGGRVLHHLIQHLPNPDTTILFVGYQAEGTRGQLIQSGESYVRIFGKEIPVRAHVRTISGLSAHADKSELMRWLSSSSGKPDLVRIVHAEEQPGRNFSQTLRDELKWKADPAKPLESVDV